MIYEQPMLKAGCFQRDVKMATALVSVFPLFPKNSSTHRCLLRCASVSLPVLSPCVCCEDSKMAVSGAKRGTREEEMQGASGTLLVPYLVAPPRVHKGLDPIKGRPIVSGSDSLISEEFQHIPTGIQHDNLTRQQRKALKELGSLKDITIKPSDKGGNIVLWPSSMYEKEAYKQLNDPKCYKRLTFNPTSIYQSQLRDLIEQAFYNGTISKEIMDGLVPETPRTPCLYLLPKVHKSTINPPGRPIVSGGGGLCEQVNKYLDFYLKPLVEDLPSYIQDTGDVLRKLMDIQLEADMWLVTLDVESLYTSIRHNDGIEAVRGFLHMSSNDNDLIELLITLLEYALTHNYFMFKEVLYLQMQGTAMGAAFAPSYANLFMGSWERSIFLTDTIPLIEKVCTWVRFIDDIFVIWQGSEVDLISFIQLLNNNTLNIKLTHKYSQTCIDFLDTKIFKGEDGFLHTEIFRKETSVNSVLHAKSSHPRPLKDSIPYGQFLRCRRICSTEASFKTQSLELAQRFSQRGYSDRTIRQGWFKASNKSRCDLLKRKSRNFSNTQPMVRFISDYNEKWQPMRKALAKFWPIITSDPTLAKSIPAAPMITYRRSRNLKDLLVHSQYKGTTTHNLFNSRGPNWGFFPCKKCLACRNMDRALDFKDTKVQIFMTYDWDIIRCCYSPCSFLLGPDACPISGERARLTAPSTGNKKTPLITLFIFFSLYYLYLYVCIYYYLYKC
ncbi:uncharacterized protein LOC143768221 [Ranitomeya variabilis]|uniref:uncharacterized protein LOC143768221 n=1 Tax=Ranitomeya variabilis TaxID=490064 RepID=UPI0040560F70